jgi:ABC-2 type transport system ATP-binding protein
MRPSSQGGATIEPVLVIEKISRKFGNVQALREVSLTIEAGELFGLLGPNGAGKTTLLSILATMLPPTSGSASVCGYDVRRDQDEVRRSIGIVFQDPSLDDDLTGRENLDFHGRLYGLDTRTRRARIGEVLSLVDLTDRTDDLVKTYSGGMRRRLEIARGLMHRPRVLFLDEPTLGLDPQTRRRIWEYIRSLKDSYGTTIILTTHYMDEADQLCSRIAIIDRGEIVALNTPEALKAGIGGDLLFLESAHVPDAFLERLQDSDEVDRITVQDGGVVLTVKRGESFIPRVFEAAQAFNMGISSVSVRKPDLEDVFIELTGRDIREETAVDAKDRMRIYLAGKRR